MMRKPTVAMAERREGKPLVEIAAREHGTFFKFIRVPPAGETNRESRLTLKAWEKSQA